MDAVSGFRALSRAVAQRVCIVFGLSYITEMLIQAGRSRMAILSVPIRTDAVVWPSRLFDSVSHFIVNTSLTIRRAYAPASVKRKMDMVSKALPMAVEKYEDADGAPLLASKPAMPEIKIRNNKSRVVKPSEEEMIFKALDARMRKVPGRQWLRFRMILRVLLDTGSARARHKPCADC